MNELGAGAPGDESHLVARLQAGDGDAYETLVRTHSGRMLAVARRMLGDGEDAQDAVQEAFVSAFRAMDRFEGTSRLSTWLHRIVVNAALMKLRTRRRKPEQSIDEMLPTFLADGHQAEPATAWKPVEALAQRETRDLVRRSIDQLPESYRIVLLLRDIEELDTAETAEFLQVNPGVVKTRLHRARQALRKVLDPHLRGDSE